MGYRGKLAEQQRARELRAQAWTLQEIADDLGVAKSSVSVWTRGVEFVPRARRTGNHGARPPRPHAQRRRKLAQIEQLNDAGRERVGTLSRRDVLLAGAALYAGEGAKTDGCVSMANTNPELLAFFCAWLRSCFEVEEHRLRARLYLHADLDLEAATAHWVAVTGVPPDRFGKPYRAKVDGTRRHAKHVYGCATVSYACARTHREIMGLVRALPIAPWSGGR
jgi:transcriptional regulator with XRE-family HTH domain